MTEQSIIARIQKLMDRTDTSRGVTEAEAATAAAMIQELLAKHNLSMAEIAAAGQTAEQKAAMDAAGGAREKRSHDRAAMYLFQRNLMAALARNNFCLHFIRDQSGVQSFGKTRKVKRHFLVGRQVNILATTMVYDYLIETMDRLLPYQGMDKRGKDALLWLEGCADRLTARLDEQRRASEAESRARAAEAQAAARHPAAAPSGPGTGLVVLGDLYGTEDDLNNDLLYGYPAGTTANRRRERLAAGPTESLYVKKARELLAATPSLSTEIARLQKEGYDEEGAMWWLGYNGGAETDAQRRKRERENQQYWKKQNKERAKAEARRSTEAYQAGHRTGGTIGLDQQVASETKRRIG